MGGYGSGIRAFQRLVGFRERKLRRHTPESVNAQALLYENENNVEIPWLGVEGGKVCLIL